MNALDVAADRNILSDSESIRLNHFYQIIKCSMSVTHWVLFFARKKNMIQRKGVVLQAPLGFQCHQISEGGGKLFFVFVNDIKYWNKSEWKKKNYEVCTSRAPCFLSWKQFYINSQFYISPGNQFTTNSFQFLAHLHFVPKFKTIWSSHFSPNSK